MARAGHVVLVGMGGDTVRLPLSYVQDRGADNHRSVPLRQHLAHRDQPRRIRAGRPGRMVTGHYGLDDVETALTASRDDPTTMKAIVRPGE